MDRTYRRARRLVPGLLTLLMLLVLASMPTPATGSAADRPPEKPANVPTRRLPGTGDPQPPLPPREGSLLHVFARAGEVIGLGGSGPTSDLVVWNPGVVTDPTAPTRPAVTRTNGFRCERSAKHLCRYRAPVTGIYDVAAGHPSAVAAADVTVRLDEASPTAIPGRLFAYRLTASPGRPLHITTVDGYRYRADTGLLGPAATLVANQTGASPQPQHPISFEPLADETLVALGIPPVPVVPPTPDLSFRGSVGEGTTRVGDGGRFSFTAAAPAVYEIAIGRTPSHGTTPPDRPRAPDGPVLRGARDAGGQAVPWDGRDATGRALPPGTGYDARITLRAGEVHLPRVDGEAPPHDQRTVTLLNPPGGVCPFANPACSTTFADGSDRWTYYPSPPGAPDAGEPTGTAAVTVLPDPVAPVVAGAVPITAPAPVARDDAGSTTYATPFALSAPGVLANDSRGTVTATGSPASGYAEIAPDGACTYIPAIGFLGVDRFTYTVTDEHGRTATATVAVTVHPGAEAVR